MPNSLLSRSVDSAALSQHLVLGRLVNRSEAIARVARRPGASAITTSSVHFANINSSKDVWWLDIPVAKACKAEILISACSSTIVQCPSNVYVEAQHIFELGYSIYEWGTVIYELANRITYCYFEARDNSYNE